MSATTQANPDPRKPALDLPPVMAALQRWRNADHEDAINLSRDDVVMLVEEVADAITSLRADLAAAQAQVVELEAEEEALKHDLTSYMEAANEYMRDAEKAEAERDAALTVQGAAKVLLTDLTDALDPMTTSREGASKDWLMAADAADEAPTCMVRPTALQMIRSALRALAGDTP